MLYSMGSIRFGSLGVCDNNSVAEGNLSAATAKAASGDCTELQRVAEIYDRLAAKTDKSSETRNRAACYAAELKQRYVTCMGNQGSQIAAVATGSTAATSAATSSGFSYTPILVAAGLGIVGLIAVAVILRNRSA
jgi:hypothetical protein